MLTEPITLPKVPAAGETITVDGTGDFTLHGVTKKVTISLEGRWDGKDVQVVGHLPIVFSDYNITAPTAPVVASVDDHGEMEFQLFFSRVKPDYSSLTASRDTRLAAVRSCIFGRSTASRDTRLAAVSLLHLWSLNC